MGDRDDRILSEHGVLTALGFCEHSGHDNRREQAAHSVYASHEALRERVAVLTEERDALRYEIAFIGRHEGTDRITLLRALHDCEDSIQYRNDEELRAERAEARVAVLEAGLRDVLDQSWFVDIDAYKAAHDRARALLSQATPVTDSCPTCESVEPSLLGARCQLAEANAGESPDAWHDRALLGGVPATKEEQT